MIDARDVRLELWDTPVGVNARLLRGSDGRWIEKVGAAPIELPISLLEGARSLRRREAGDADALRSLAKHGAELWKALRPFQCELRRLMKSQAVSRFVLASAKPLVGSPGTSPGTALAVHRNLRARDALDLLWPALYTDETRGNGEIDERRAPFLRGAWSLLIRDELDDGPDDAPVRLETLNVLVLLTSLEAEHSEVRAQLERTARTLVHETRRSFQGNPAVEVLVCASARYRCEDGRLLGEPGADLWFEDGATLEHMVRHGAPPGEAARPLHAVVTLGHSNAPAEGWAFGELATALSFSLPDHEHPLDVSGAEFADWLRGPAERPSARTVRPPGSVQVIVAANCASVGLGPALRTCAPHVVVTSSVVYANDQAGIATRLISHLADGLTTGEALRRAIEQIPAGTGRFLAAARTLHFAATVHDRPFASREECALIGYYRRVLPEHEHVHTTYGGERSATLRQIHVPLNLHEDVIAEPLQTNSASPTDLDSAGQSVQPADRPHGNTSATTSRPIVRALDRGSLVPDSDTGSGGTRSGRRYLAPRAITFRQLVEPGARRCFVLRGEAGAGKTTTLRHFALDPPPGLLPIYVSLPVWLRDVTRPDSYGLEALVARLAAFLKGDAELVRAWHARAGSGDVVVLLDGFDELANAEERNVALHTTAALAAGWQRARIVVAARETADLDSLEMNHWIRARLRPLDPLDQQPLLLANWFVSAGSSEEAAIEKAKTWVHALQRANDRVAEMAGNPLMLSFIAQFVLDGWTVEDFERGRHVLMREVLDRLLARRYTKGPEIDPVLDVDHARQALRWIAWQSLMVPTRSISGVAEVADLLQRRPQYGQPDACEALKEAVHSLRRGFKSWDALARQLGVQGGVFRPEYGDGARDWRFSHNLLQEALAAEHWWFVVLGRKGDTDAVMRHLEDRLREGTGVALDFWTEPTALLAGWMQDDALMLPLVEKPATLDLGLRVMRALDRVAPDTWRGVLEKLPHWHERSDRDRLGKGARVQAYEAIAAKAGDHRAIKEVLDVLEWRAKQC
jgi:hypothetical protein